MSHAETVHTLHPAAGATDAIVGFADALRYDALPEEVRHYARRHLLDTVGVMIAGAGGDVATRAEAVLAAVRPAGKFRCPAARAAPTCSTPPSSAAPPRMASNSTTATAMARRIAAAPSSPRCCASPITQNTGGRALIEAIVAGYETVIRSAAPAHPTCASVASIRPARSGRSARRWRPRKLRGLPRRQFANALGIAASSAAGLFAFVNGGGDIKRLHAGHASREGMQAALLAEQGVEGPPGVIEARDGFMQAFAFGRIDKARRDHAAAGRADTA